MIVLLLLVSLPALIRTQADKDTDLELVQILFRHGDRTPTRKYAFDLFTDEVWLKYGGYGQLTQKGMGTAYKLGEYLRAKYNSFIGDFYDRIQVRARSTDMDRTLMTAQLVLTGLYPPKGYQEWKSGFQWQPMAVHTVEKNDDILFNFRGCPKADRMNVDDMATDAEWLDKVAETKDLMAKINTGIGNGSNLTYGPNLEALSDSLYIQTENKMPLPSWATPDLYTRIRHEGRRLYHFYYRNNEISRLWSGPVLHQMRQNMLTKQNNASDPTRLLLYSGHDSFVAALWKLVNISVPEYLTQPNYCAALVLELRRNQADGKYFVRILWKDNSNTEPVEFREVRQMSCQNRTLCPLETFMQVTEPLAVADIRKECSLGNSGAQGSMLIVYFLATLTALLGIVFGLCSCARYLVLRRRHRRRQFQMSLGEDLNLMMSDGDDEYTPPDQEVYSRGMRHLTNKN